MKPYVNGTVCMVEGPKYDLDRVIAAHDRVLDALVGRFGAGQLGCEVSGKWKRFDWSGEGRAKSREFWTALAKTYDATPQALIVALPQNVIVEVRLLGMSWVVQDAVTDLLTLPDGCALNRLNPVPTISVFGPYDTKRKQFGLLPEASVDAISSMAQGALAELDLEFGRTTETTPVLVKAGATDACRFQFPHDAYGTGRALLAVRCKSSDGGEPDPSSNATAFLEN